jgi:hypothetical protein
MAEKDGSGTFGGLSLADLLKTGTELGTQALGGTAKPNQITPTYAPSPAAAPAKPNYVLYGSIAGGVVLLVVVLVVLKK